MAKTTQVMKLTACGRKYTVIQHNDEKINPFWLYEHTRVHNMETGWTNRKKLVVKYQTMESVLYHLISDEAFRKDIW